VTFGELVEYRWWRLRFRWPWRRWAVVEVDHVDRHVAKNVDALSTIAHVSVA
jgi:hypothetical protein